MASMEKETKDKIASLIGEAMTRARGKRANEAQNRQRQENFQSQFRTIRLTVIGPVLYEFERDLRDRGYEATVGQKDGQITEYGEDPDGISLLIDKTGLHTAPKIEFLGYRTDEQLRVFFTIVTQNDASTKPKGCYSTELTAAEVEDVTKRFLEEIFPHLPAPRPKWGESASQS